MSAAAQRHQGTVMTPHAATAKRPVTKERIGPFNGPLGRFRPEPACHHFSLASTISLPVIAP